MGPRAKKVRSVKTKDSSSSTIAEQENVGNIEDEINETNGSNEQNNIAVLDHGEEEQPPLKKGRGRQKKPEAALKVNKEAEDEVNGENETKEAVNDADPPTKGKARRRKKKAEDDKPEVMPKRKDRSAKVEAQEDAEEPAGDEANEEPAVEAKSNKLKREKKVPVKKAGRKKKEDEDAKLTEEESVEEAEKLSANDEPSKDEDVDPAGAAKATKKGPGRGKATAKAAEEAAPSKKKAPRGKKVGKGDAADEEVEVDGKKLRVNVEHCKS